MIDNIKILLGITDASKDTLLQLLINDAKDFATAYCNLEIYETKLDNIIIKMVIERFNKLGSEGINSKNYSGISESYADDYNPTIYKQLNKNRRLKML